MLEIEFIGHACFRIWEDGRPTVLTDPYTHSDVGLVDEGETFEAETVIVSSLKDLSHNNTKLASGNPAVINALDVAAGKTEASVNGESVVGILVAENPQHPTGPDDNGMYAFKAGGLWFAHMGDVGYGLSEEQLQPWKGKCDVLLAITGEVYSLSLDELEPMIDILNPRYVFPMHYYLPPPGSMMKPVSNFLNRRRDDPVLVVGGSRVQLPLPEIKPGRPTIVVLEPSSYPAQQGRVSYGSVTE